jgi:acetolactate synthase I/II/III large subunit
MSATATRIGGHLVVDCLEAAGVDAVFGVPGIHALAIWDGLADSSIRYVGMRTELAAGFAADGYARAGTRPGVLLTTTGPGSFVSACALMEARTSYVPIVNIVSQVPRDVIGTNRGFLHELPTQSRVLSSFAKWHAVAGAAEQLPGLIAEAFRQAASAPSGPVVLEIPVDVLEGETDVPAPGELDVAPVPLPAAEPALLAEAAGLLAAAERPVLWAGGGVLRAGGSAAFRELAERLDAPAATTYMGKGAIPGDHPLALGSACDEGAFQEILRTADVVLAIGTELGAETTGQWTLQFEGRLIQVDARAEHLGLTYEGLGIAGDARAVLEALVALVPERRSDGAERVAAVHARIASGLAAQGRDAELQLLGDLRAALRRNDILVCDMTLTGYLAAPFLDVYAPGTFLYPLGSGTLGYAWPAAIGAKVARPEAQVLAVHGDGGVLYSVLELLSARQHGIAAKLLVVDDGGYGILRVYQESAYGRRNAVDLVQPDFPQLGGALGVPVFEARPRALAAALAEAFAFEGPALIHLPQTVVYPEATR